MIVRAPLAGRVLALSDVPDPVFAEGMVGPGLAIEPLHDDADALSPVDGVLATVRAHAFVVTAADGRRSVLVHLGVDTVGLADGGFDVRAARGDACAAGDVVVRWSPVTVRGAGLSAVCPVVALSADPDQVDLLVPPGRVVTAGDPLLRWGEVAPG